MYKIPLNYIHHSTWNINYSTQNMVFFNDIHWIYEGRGGSGDHAYIVQLDHWYRYIKYTICIFKRMVQLVFVNSYAPYTVLAQLYDETTISVIAKLPHSILL